MESQAAKKISKTDVVEISSISEAQEVISEVTTDLVSKSSVTVTSKEAESATSQSESQQTVVENISEVKVETVTQQISVQTIDQTVESEVTVQSVQSEQISELDKVCVEGSVERVQISEQKSVELSHITNTLPNTINPHLLEEKKEDSESSVVKVDLEEKDQINNLSVFQDKLSTSEQKTFETAQITSQQVTKTLDTATVDFINAHEISDIKFKNTTDSLITEKTEIKSEENTENKLTYKNPTSVQEQEIVTSSQTSKEVNQIEQVELTGKQQEQQENSVKTVKFELSAAIELQKVTEVKEKETPKSIDNLPISNKLSIEQPLDTERCTTDITKDSVLATTQETNINLAEEVIQKSESPLELIATQTSNSKPDELLESIQVKDTNNNLETVKSLEKDLNNVKEKKTFNETGGQTVIEEAKVDVTKESEVTLKETSGENLDTNAAEIVQTVTAEVPVEDEMSSRYSRSSRLSGGRIII